MIEVVIAVRAIPPWLQLLQKTETLRLWGWRCMLMQGFIESEDRIQQAPLPNTLKDCVDAENSGRVIDASLDEIEFAALGFSRTTATGRLATIPHAAED